MAETIGLKLNEQINGDTQLYFGPLQYFGRCRGCNSNLASNCPASQYQRQKIIQNQVRVQSSLYSMNLKALNAYQKPNTIPETIVLGGLEYIISPGVNWNQMSDRRMPHHQPNPSASGSNPGGNSVKRTITRLRPGALSPGGTGVDIKHNSYERYLNRIKGKAPLRRGVIPPNYGKEFIPFNPAYPIYGGKVIKTSLVNGCNCPDVEDGQTGQIRKGEEKDKDKDKDKEREKLLYINRCNDMQSDIYDIKYNYSVNDKVIIIAKGRYFKNSGKIVDIIKTKYLVEFAPNNKELFFYSDIILDIPTKCPIDPCLKKSPLDIIVTKRALELQASQGILNVLGNLNILSSLQILGNAGVDTSDTY